ncbi:chemotaxis protein CheW [bacterium]|nr:chemotaxis protein CheW [bacterium]
MSSFLFVRARSRVAALVVADVVETMRPLPVETVPGLPSFVRGLAVIRGAPVPVVDLGSLLALGATQGSRRFVTVRAGERRVALAVEDVLGVHELDALGIHELPPLVPAAESAPITAIGALDLQLMVVLRAARIVPEDVWRTLAAREGSP